MKFNINKKSIAGIAAVAIAAVYTVSRWQHEPDTVDATEEDLASIRQSVADD
jgi:hypothetical protein